MLIDTHAHTYLDKYKEDLSEVVQRAIEANVTKVFLPNIDSTTIEELFRLCDRYPSHFYPMVGLHPCSVNQDYQEELFKLESYLALLPWP